MPTDTDSDRDTDSAVDDSDTDRCGHPTGDGGTCQNPATEDGHCWIDSHGGDVTPGRSSKYTEQRARDAITAARRGKSKAGCARSAGVDKATLHRWLERDDLVYDGRDFRNAFRQARAEGEDRLIEGGLSEESNMDSQMARFLLSTSHNYIKTEKREVEQETTHKGEVAGEFSVNITHHRVTEDDIDDTGTDTDADTDT